MISPVASPVTRQNLRMCQATSGGRRASQRISSEGSREMYPDFRAATRHSNCDACQGKTRVGNPRSLPAAHRNPHTRKAPTPRRQITTAKKSPGPPWPPRPRPSPKTQNPRRALPPVPTPPERPKTATQGPRARLRNPRRFQPSGRAAPTPALISEPPRRRAGDRGKEA
jgi:hypothetical protein